MKCDNLVLVTGGTGFVGSHIVEELLKCGFIVRSPVHQRAAVVHHPNLEYIPADLSSDADCVRIMRGVHSVVHAAGTVGAVSVGSQAMFDGLTLNLLLTLKVLRSAWAAGVKKILLFGSSTAYPNVDHAVSEKEMWDGPPHPSYFGYGWMRRYLELLGEYVARQSKMSVLLLRPTAVYGPRDNFNPATCHVVPALIRRALAKENPFVVWGTGNEMRDFLHVRDLARAVVRMLEKGKGCDPVNIGFGRGICIRDVVKVVLKAAGHDRADIVFDASRPTAIPRRLVDISKARKLFGFEPEITFEAGISETIDWYRKQESALRF
ncbi:MAG: NAD-dependent epimerase/dehydratase family protein [Kiritimatiellia bacterium]|nr:NAD-dependent epimerase/dehydratase family protein [Kiritimatiellia bacterium]